eukprot:scaffold11008_cov171-Skeletonema_dohrnii-CCMP3373.AAC.2
MSHGSLGSKLSSLGSCDEKMDKTRVSLHSGKDRRQRRYNLSLEVQGRNTLKSILHCTTA